MEHSYRMMKDTCDWCGRSTDSIQLQPGNNTGLCPVCCPDVNEEEMVEDAPYTWHFMNEEERSAWKSGKTMDEIREEFEWASSGVFH